MRIIKSALNLRILNLEFKRNGNLRCVTRAGLSSSMVISPSSAMIPAKKSQCGSSLPRSFRQHCRAASVPPVRGIARAHRTPLASESFRRNAAAHPLSPPSIYIVETVPRSAFGKGADIVQPSKQDESQIHIRAIMKSTIKNRC